MVKVTSANLSQIKTQPISPGLACKAIEVIPLADISDIYNVSTGSDIYEFIIRRSRHGSTIYFSSPLRELIVKVSFQTDVCSSFLSLLQTIRSAKGRLKDAPPQLAERFSRFSNVSATLLHIGLLSVDLNDEELRGAAYDLLGAVCTYLNFEKSPIVASKGILLLLYSPTYWFN